LFQYLVVDCVIISRLVASRTLINPFRSDPEKVSAFIAVCIRIIGFVVNINSLIFIGICVA